MSRAADDHPPAQAFVDDRFRLIRSLVLIFPLIRSSFFFLGNLLTSASIRQAVLLSPMRILRARSSGPRPRR